MTNTRPTQTKRISRKDMTDVEENRCNNLYLLSDSYPGGFKSFAAKVGLSPNDLNHYIKSDQTRKLGEDEAREMEKKLELPPGWLDERHFSPEEKELFKRFLEFPHAHIERAYTLTLFAQHSELFATILKALEPIALRELGKLHDKQHVAAAKKRKRKAS